MACDNFLWFPQAAKGGTNLGTAAAQPLGETQDDFFSKKKALELKSFGFGAENPNTISSATGGAGAGKAKFGTFKISKEVDKASTPLYVALACGAHFPQVMLAIRKAGGSKLVYLQYCFRMVFVVNITWSGGGGEENPGEDVEFVYGAMGIHYVPQKTDGTADTPVEGMWSVVMNKATLDMPGDGPLKPDWMSTQG